MKIKFTRINIVFFPRKFSKQKLKFYGALKRYVFFQTEHPSYSILQDPNFGVFSIVFSTMKHIICRNENREKFYKNKKIHIMSERNVFTCLQYFTTISGVLRMILIFLTGIPMVILLIDFTEDVLKIDHG